MIFGGIIAGIAIGFITAFFIFRQKLKVVSMVVSRDCLPVNEAYYWSLSHLGDRADVELENYARDLGITEFQNIGEILADARFNEAAYEAYKHEKLWKEAIEIPSIIPLILLQQADIYVPDIVDYQDSSNHFYQFITALRDHDGDRAIEAIHKIMDSYIAWAEQITPLPLMRPGTVKPSRSRLRNRHKRKRYAQIAKDLKLRYISAYPVP